MSYPKYIYDKAWQQLTQRKHQVQQQAALVKEEVYRRIPAIREIEREMARGSSSVAKVVITNPDQAEERIMQLAKENLALQDKRAQLLMQNGFPSGCMEDQYACIKCKDQGYASGSMCTCLADMLEKQAYALLSKSAPLKDCTFDSFVLDYYPQRPVDGSGIEPRSQMRDMLAYCKKYVAGFFPQAESLLMMGNTGLGKTHLSLAIAGEVIAAGYGVIYTPVQRLMDTLEAEKFSRNMEARESYSENTRLTVSCDLLVLDDMGTEFMTQFSNSVLYNIINTRLIESRPTIISTNLRIGEIEEKYSQRMVSRLMCGYRVMEFFGKDIRMIRMARGD